jgi:hypothetical protein
MRFVTRGVAWQGGWLARSSPRARLRGVLWVLAGLARHARGRGLSSVVLRAGTWRSRMIGVMVTPLLPNVELEQMLD